MERWILVLLIGLTLNQITRTHQDVVGREPGSGGDGDDGDEASGIDGMDKEVTRSHEDELEGSAYVEDEDLTPCQRLQVSASKTGAFSPQCTQDGKFKPSQCNARLGECWCVDKDGKERPGTKTRSPSRPLKCTATGVEFVVPTRKPPGARPPVFSYTPSSDADDIVFHDSSTPKPFSPEKTTERRTAKMQPTTTSAYQEHDHSSDGNVSVQKPGMFSFIFKDPLILAGIIGGAVLALLCIVLLVMFTIYRMRKKDEGSYALDEPKKSYGFAYTRARDQEFFA